MDSSTERRPSILIYAECLASGAILTFKTLSDGTTIGLNIYESLNGYSCSRIEKENKHENRKENRELDYLRNTYLELSVCGQIGVMRIAGTSG